MRHRWHVRSVGYVFHDNELDVDRRRGVGFRAKCECGYQGGTRKTYQEARGDGRGHARDQDARYAEGCGVSG